MPSGPHLSRSLSLSKGVRGVTLSLLPISLLAGCLSTVPVADPSPEPEARQICASVLAALPSTNLDQQRREVSPGELSVGWGDPVITLRCGVPKPAAMTRQSECLEVNGVGWLPETGEGGMLFTTHGRAALIEVGVPAAYAPEVNALVDVAAAISANDPLDKPCA